MTGKDLFREIGNISEDYITEAQNYQGQKRGHISIINNHSFRKVMATAACLVICAGLVITVQKMDIRTDSAKESAKEEMAPMEMAAEMSADMAVPEEKKEMLHAVQMPAATVEEEMKAATKESIEEAGVRNEASLTDELVGQNEKLPNDEMYVVEYGNVKNGQDAWDEFMTHINAGEAASVHIMNTTTQNDSVIIELIYNGELFYVNKYDSEDALNRQNSAKLAGEYTHLIVEENPISDGKHETVYLLMNDEAVYEILRVVK